MRYYCSYFVFPVRGVRCVVLFHNVDGCRGCGRGGGGKEREVRGKREEGKGGEKRKRERKREGKQK